MSKVQALYEREQMKYREYNPEKEIGGGGGGGWGGVIKFEVSEN